MAPVRRTFKMALVVLLIIALGVSLQSKTEVSRIEREPIDNFIVAQTPVSEWLLVEAFDATTDDGWTEVGANPYLDYQDQPTNYIYCTSGGGAGKNHGDYDFFSTSASNSVTDVNVTIYHNTAERTRVTIFNSTTSDTIDFADSGGGWASETITQTSGGEELEVFWSSKSELDAAYVMVNAKSQGGAGQVEVDEVKIGVTGTETGGVAYDVTVNELIELYDSTSTEINLSLTVAELLDLSETPTTAVSLTLTVLELIELFDSVSVEILGGGIDYSIVINEILPLDDTINTIWRAVLGISEILPLDEIISTVWNATLEIFETVDLFDSVTAIIPFAGITLIINEIIAIGSSTLIEGGLEGLNLFYDVFLSNNMWSYLGPAALVIIGFVLVRKDMALGVIWFIVECLFIAQYATLVEANPDYLWHMYILIFGGLFTLVYPMMDRLKR